MVVDQEDVGKLVGFATAVPGRCKAASPVVPGLVEPGLKLSVRKDMRAFPSQRRNRLHGRHSRAPET